MLIYHDLKLWDQELHNGIQVLMLALHLLIKSLKIDIAYQEAVTMLTAQKVPLSDGYYTQILVLYCPKLTNTIISPLDFTHPILITRQFNILCIIEVPECCNLLLSSVNSLDKSFVNLIKENVLYFIHNKAQIATPKQITPSLRHPGPSQHSYAAATMLGIPPNLSSQSHPMHTYQVFYDAKIKRLPTGATSTKRLLSFELSRHKGQLRNSGSITGKLSCNII